ncbi:hypothetical protein ATO6_18575 [Oceanicola sp. 22II-s10i]|uniref:DUF302 domain-containing protein n=1 Tax=Oceanicola sp. 22II-s10i TaxID=1317116 RepID=UPI000B524FD2|nr:DUF302 domain-containing protein [Oceanicola sp. 22II-s10i]OWU83450.1 hypothetical protein ATO6_18575 [Oceanicola sp. 22II-s10i]
MRHLSLALILALPLPAVAEEIVAVPFEGSYDDAAFAVENAIVGRGLVVDHVSHVGEMLNRTAADVGATKQIFTDAQVFQFCSAVVSRQVMEADPLNVGYCPYGIFVFENEDGVKIGYRTYPDGPMDVVEDLLKDIVEEAGG